MSHKIKIIDQAINNTVRDKNHVFLMAGQSCVEWMKYALTLDKDPEKFNFVPVMKALKFIEREFDAEKNALNEEKKLTNIVTFGMSVNSIFEQSIFAQNINPDDEKKAPVIDFFIGNKLATEINDICMSSDVERTIVAMDIDEEKCVNWDSNHLDLWKLPDIRKIGKVNVLFCESSHYLYLGYMYLTALAVMNGAELDNDLFTSVNNILEFIEDNYADLLIKPDTKTI